MKLSKIYTNNDLIFTPIEFNLNNEGENLLNVIFAESLDPKNKSKNLHNKGKTILVYLIDFLLLKDADYKAFPMKYRNKFKNLEFYIEIFLNSGSYLTINRSLEEGSPISLKLHELGKQDYTKLEAGKWSHYRIAFSRAEEIVNSNLDLQVVKPWNYRQGLTYFLRTQQDYNDAFQISKFSKGSDSAWKPYMAHILGLDSDLIIKKYEMDEKIEKLVTEKNIKAREVVYDEDDYNKLNNEIEIAKEDLKKISTDLDSFKFSSQEIEINKSMTKKLELQDSNINSLLYNVNYDIHKINDSLNKKITFDLKKIDQIFQEAELYFPNQLKKDYEELVDFNRQISRERKKGLKEQLLKLENQKKSLEKNLNEIDNQRSEYIKIMKETDTIEKYKLLQKEFSNKKASVINLEHQLASLKEIIKLSNDIDTERITLQKIKNKIINSLTSPSGKHIAIVKDFSKLVKTVFDQTANLYCKPNKEGNLEFDIAFKETENILSKETDEAKGTSYKKVLCVLFDLAILRQYAKDSFFHFVYHDGIFESMEDRFKEQLLNVIRESVSSYGIQCIFTIIVTDLLRDDNGRQIYFPDEEVVLKLNDLGDEGRLFKTSVF